MRRRRRISDETAERLARAEEETAAVNLRVELVERRMDEIEEALALRRELLRKRGNR